MPKVFTQSLLEENQLNHTVLRDVAFAMSLQILAPQPILNRLTPTNDTPSVLPGTKWHKTGEKLSGTFDR